VAAGTGTGYLVLAACALVAYAGLNAVTTAHRALIAETYDEDTRPAATGSEELALLMGTTLGVAAGGVLIEWHTWAPFAAAAVAVPLLCVPTIRRMRGREEAGKWTPAATRPPLAEYARVAGTPGVRSVLLAQGLWVLGYAALPAFFVLYAERVLDLRPAIAGALLVAFGVVCGVTMLVAGVVARPERHLRLLGAGVVLLGGGLLAMTPADSAVEAAPGLAAAAVGFGLLSTIGFPVLTRFIPEGEAGAYTAVYFSVRAVAGAIALPAAGWTIALTGSYRALIAFGGVAALLALGPILSLAGWSPPRPRAPLPGPPRPDGALLARRALILATISGATLAAGLIVAHTALQGVDEAGFRALNALGPGPELLDEILVGPDFRNYVLLTALTVLAALVWRRGSVVRSLVVVTLSGLVAFLLVRVMWLVWQRPRPQETLDDIAIEAHDWSSYASFPSGHVAVWTAMGVAMAALFPRLLVPLLVAVAAVAVTRIVSGAHFPTDVLAAAVLGWASASAVLGVMGASPGRPAQERAAATTRAESRTGRNELTSPR
jgi:membrane-associated phospholipid phosphatase